MGLVYIWIFRYIGGISHQPSYPMNWLTSGELILNLILTPAPSQGAYQCHLIIVLGKSFSWVVVCSSEQSPHCSREAFEVPSVVAAALAASRTGVHPRFWDVGYDGWGLMWWNGYDQPICFRFASLVLGRSFDCPSASWVTLKYMGQIIHYLTNTIHK